MSLNGSIQLHIFINSKEKFGLEQFDGNVSLFLVDSEFFLSLNSIVGIIRHCYSNSFSFKLFL
jgi:hypothetical protein